MADVVNGSVHDEFQRSRRREMAKVEVRTRNGDKLTVETNDPDVIRQYEASAWDATSNVSSVSVTPTED